MSRSTSRNTEAALPPSAVTSDDLDRAVQLTVSVLRQAPPTAWDARVRG